MDSELLQMITANRTQNPLMMGRDRKETAKFERMRQMEAMRKQRIFNAKDRLIGVDVGMLERQRQEKLDRERLTQLENEKHERLAERIAKQAIEEEQRIEKDKRRICKDIDCYRLLHQKKTFSRDYDLEKPPNVERLKTGGDDERFGVTIFEGEDDNLKSRIKHQKLQLKTWLLQQMKERQVVNQVERSQDRIHEQAYIERAKRLLELEKMEEHCRIRMQIADSEYNMALAKRKEHQKNEQRRMECQWNHQEMLNTITSDLMQENPELARSSLGPNRINPMMYKGMTDDMINDIRATQQAQIEEKKEAKIIEKYENRSWDRYNSYVLNLTSQADGELELKLQNDRKQLELYNELLGKKQKAMEKNRNEITYANKITEKYFEQFNRGSR